MDGWAGRVNAADLVWAFSPAVVAAVKADYVAAADFLQLF
jgi:hypothetical protein